MAHPLSPLGPLSHVVATVCIAVHPVMIFEYNGAMRMALNSSLASEEFFSLPVSVNPTDHGPSLVHDPSSRSS